MTVFFGVLVCILINLQYLASSQDVNTTTTDIYEVSSVPSSTTISSANVTTALSTTVGVYTESNSTENSTATPFPEAEHCTFLDPPVDQLIFVEKTSANITWLTNQTNNQCVPTQIIVICIALEEENIYGQSWIKNISSVNVTIREANITSVRIKNLSEFTNYTCIATLSSFNAESEATAIKFQTKEDVSSPPSNLTVHNITSTSFRVKWEPPEKNPGIFITYHLRILNNGANYFVPESCGQNDTNQNITEVQTTEEEYIFENASPYYNYTIVVSVENQAGNSPTTSEDVTTEASGSQEPRDVLYERKELQIGLNSIIGNLSWKTPCVSNGPINVFHINLEGSYVLDGSIQDIKNCSVNATGSEGYFMLIEGLMPASEYNISISASGGEQLGESFSFSVSTEDNEPGPPVINNITDIGSNFFVVSWNEPERKAGTITKYEIEITTSGPLYQLDLERCSPQNKDIFEKLGGDTTTYNFTQAFPYYNYSISVTAFTSKGAGDSNDTSIITPPSVPEQPQDFEFLFEEVENITGLLSWILPCNINGPIREIIVTLFGNYTEDDSTPTNYTRSIPYETNTFNYTLDVQLLEAYNYEANVQIVLEDGTIGEKATVYNRTPDGFPGAPTTGLAEVDANSFRISWEPPNTRTGIIRFYRVTVISEGPLYKTDCKVYNKIFSNIAEGDIRTFKFTKGEPHYSYIVSVEASTSRGFGDNSTNFVETAQSVPENVQYITPIPTHPTGEEYDSVVNISFKEPCYLNGPLKYFELNLVGTRPNHASDVQQYQSQDHSFLCGLQPEYDYSFTIKICNEKDCNETDPDYFKAPAGVPHFPSKPVDINIEKGPSSAQITLKKESFSETAGDIRYVALILSDKNITGGDFYTWNGQEWPVPTSMDNGEYYQLTEEWWNPFKDADNVTVNIGNDTNCKETDNYCNKPLEKNKEYYLIIRLFTNNFYKNSPTIYFKTDDISKLGSILGIIFGLLGFALLGVAVFLLWKKKLVKLPPLYSRKSSTVSCNNNTTSIPIHKFAQYCKHLENNPEKCTEQYALLEEKTKEAVRMQTMVYSGLTENRRKNRYTNILPYDDTRVKLLIEEDDEIGSDYINASYIKGFSGKVEYIATQGPLQTTCRDFWKMVIQENVSIIVMVTQFVEQNKEKCFKYFPDNHESMTIGEDMEVRCAMELHLGTYCVRTLQVKKDTTQVSVTHMQYLDWPDFSVPNGTETMLQFCYQLRERLKVEGGCVVVHCSAGVGRSGTLIATDILLQNIKAGNNIDVFNTVLELRKQRAHMVQKQKQYMYIHSLIRDSLEQPQIPGVNENTEPLYENVQALQTKHDDINLFNKEKEVESQF